MTFDRLPEPSLWPDEVFDELTEPTPKLRRIQLYGKGRAVDRAAIAPGHWGVPTGEDEVVDLGKTIHLLVFARRPKALDVSRPEGGIVVYDPRHPDFRRIRAESAGQESGCLYGVSFLVFERSTKDFYELFFGTKRSRPEAKNLFPYLPLTVEEIAGKRLDERPRGPLPVSLRSSLDDANGQPLYVPKVAASSIEIGGPPVDARLIRRIDQFLGATSDW